MNEWVDHLLTIWIVLSVVGRESSGMYVCLCVWITANKEVGRAVAGEKRCRLVKNP